MSHRIRLQQPDRDRVRVRDLARELNVHHRVVLAFLRSIGEYVSSELSLVEAPVARTVRKHFPAPPRATSVPATPTEEAITAPGSSTDGLSAPTKRAHRENNPFTGVLTEFTPRHAEDGRRPPPTGGYTTHTPRNDPGDYSAAGAVEPSETMKYLEWKVRGIGDVERDVWLAHGLSERHAHIAADCIEAGLGPADLARIVAGYSVLHRVTHGEPANGVARLLMRDSGVA